MQINRRRELRIQMTSQYESLTLGASATISHIDLGYADDEWLEIMRKGGDESEEVIKELITECEAMVNDMIEVDLRAARKKASRESFIQKERN